MVLILPKQKNQCLDDFKCLAKEKNFLMKKQERENEDSYVKKKRKGENKDSNLETTSN